ncbi:hypothetical protein AURDEDRAFT_117095 [Auricularia subglabra TFB-10046 SS5]|uniref:Uncharacterized protein n=1 Tax=Auricularia subglabra (strain TFB-10046 / SS5) TaxID=717982 RepID=J0LG65_AURST|nr:hypothetical protein AURDEDRAFT_117095 [Auricularia subglabra TFB-10046 SS5]
MSRPQGITLPVLAAPQPQPSFLGTPFASSSTVNPFEYPFAPAPPSPQLARTSPVAHTHATSPVHPRLQRQSPPVPVPPRLSGSKSTGVPDAAEAARLVQLQLQAEHDRKRRGSFA